MVPYQRQFKVIVLHIFSISLRIPLNLTRYCNKNRVDEALQSTTLSMRFLEERTLGMLGAGGMVSWSCTAFSQDSILLRVPRDRISNWSRSFTLFRDQTTSTLITLSGFSYVYTTHSLCEANVSLNEVGIRFSKWDNRYDRILRQMLTNIFSCYGG